MPASIRSPARERRAQEAAAALSGLLHLLQARDYAFVTPTPASHARVLARPSMRTAKDLRGALGWSLPFREEVIDPEIVAHLRAAGVLQRRDDGLLRSDVRVSRLGPDLFLHSAYPTDGEDAVFFGPDSHRFAALIREELARTGLPSRARVADVGAGSGVGALTAARCRPGIRLWLTDTNPRALELARINLAAAGVEARFVEGPELDAAPGEFDLILANPPYIIDDAGRAYRDGGDMHGGRIAHEIAAKALARLRPGGRMILYTGSAIVAGDDVLGRALRDLAVRGGCGFACRELDPDVFGEELSRPAYADVDRIALIAAVFTRPTSDGGEAHVRGGPEKAERPGP